MKILYLSPGCFDKGGISRYNRYQIRALRGIVGEENVKVLSVLGPTGESIEEPFRVEWNAGGVGPWKNLMYVTRTFKEVLDFQPDIVWPTLINLSALARFVSRMRPRTKTILNVYGLEMWSPWRASNRWGWKGIDYIVSDCHFTAAYLNRANLLGLKGIETIWDCVDLDKFFPAPPRKEVLDKYGIPDPASGINLLTLGRMTEYAAHKGYERLMKVFATIAREAPEVRLIYAGGGNLAATLREKAKSHGLAERVYFTGFVHENDLPDIYRSAHIFSLVSDRGKWRGEGIPLTPLEAAACGVPILVGNQDGSQEAVIEGVNGFVFDPFDLKAQGAVIVRLSRDGVLRTKMARAARNRIEDEFSFPIFAEKHRQLIARWFPQLAEA